MINNKKIVAIIPARGGSKRLPRKNILPLDNKPLIGWTIDAAMNSKYIDEIFVSTDDAVISKTAEHFGLQVPELRPSKLAGDQATTKSVIDYTLRKYFPCADIVLILQPTSPFRSYEHIDSALKYFEENCADGVVSVTKCEHNPLWSNVLPDNMSMENFLRTGPGCSQKSPDFYRLNGAIYIYGAKFYLSASNLYSNNTYAYVMDNLYSIDIDTEQDYRYAQFLKQNYIK